MNQLASLSVLQLVLLVGGVVLFSSIVSIGLIYLLKTTNGGSIRLFNGVVDITQGAKKKSPHASCRHVEEIIDLFWTGIEIQRKIDQIELALLPKDQMTCAEQVVNSIIMKLERTYIALLSTKIPDVDLTTSREFSLYCLCLEKIRSSCLFIIKTSVVENHYLARSPEEWIVYKERIVDSLVEKQRQILNDFYTLPTPTRAEVREWNLRSMDGIKREYINMFNYMKTYAFERNAQIDGLKKEFSEKVEEAFGRKGAVPNT